MSKKVAYYGIFAALAILMGYIEQMIPIPIPVPGIKLGIANVIVLIVMYFMDNKTAFGISMVRVLMSALLFGGLSGFLYSMSGAVLSFFVMVIVKKIKSVSVIGVSVVGGIFHNIGQLAVASLVLKTPGLVFYLPVLLIAGVITGVITGVIAKYCLKYLETTKA